MLPGQGPGGAYQTSVRPARCQSLTAKRDAPTNSYPLQLSGVPRCESARVAEVGGMRAEVVLLAEQFRVVRQRACRATRI